MDKTRQKKKEEKKQAVNLKVIFCLWIRNCSGAVEWKCVVWVRGPDPSRTGSRYLRSVLLMSSDTCCRYSLAYRTTGSVSFRSRGARENVRKSSQSTAGASSCKTGRGHTQHYVSHEPRLQGTMETRHATLIQTAQQYERAVGQK